MMAGKMQLTVFCKRLDSKPSLRVYTMLNVSRR